MKHYQTSIFNCTVFCFLIKLEFFNLSSSVPFFLANLLPPPTALGVLPIAMPIAVSGNETRLPVPEPAIEKKDEIKPEKEPAVVKVEPKTEPKTEEEPKKEVKEKKKKKKVNFQNC